MSMIGNIRRKIGRAVLGIKSDISSSDLYALMSGTGYARSGAVVNWLNSLCVTAVLGCVRVIAEDLSKVPLKLYLDADKTKSPATMHPLYNIVARAPNPLQTSFEFREMFLASAVLTGNGYAYIVRGVDGRVLELWPLPPSCVFVRRIMGTWDIRYTISFPNGIGTIECGPENILHLRGLTMDGILGVDIIRMAREAIGLSMATEEQQAKFAKGGLKSAGVLETPTNLTKEQVKDLSELWMTEWGGAHNADKTPILYGGLKFTPTTVSGKDSEIIATRTHQVEEIARAFRVYPILIGSSSGLSSRSSITDIFSAHVSHCLQPWAVRIEQVFDKALLTQKEIDAGYYFQVVLQGLLRGDTAARSAYYHNGIIDGWMTRNEARSLEEMDPLPGLDKPLEPLNVQPLNADGSPGGKDPAVTSIGGDPAEDGVPDNSGDINEN